jgi:hypothetical protein
VTAAAAAAAAAEVLAASELVEVLPAPDGTDY